MAKPTPNLKLKSQIILKGYTVGNFARKVGIHPRTLSIIMSGRYIPSDETETRIAKALGVKRSSIF